MQILSKKPIRRRGVILAPKGLRKLHQAKSELEIEHNLRRYTLEAISEETGLTPTTLSKIFVGSSGVDKRTLQCCFDAFNLTLEKDDYCYPNSHPGDFEISETSPSECPCPTNSASDSSLEAFPVPNQIPKTHKMNNHQHNLQPSPFTLPTGTIPLNSSLYIQNLPLASLCYEAIRQPGAMVNICAPKQTGKTSLMNRILAYAKIQSYRNLSLNLQLADAEILENLERFLQWFCARVSRQLGLPNQTANFWHNSLGSKSNATDYLEDILSNNCDCPLAIAIDELNQLFAYPDIAREFILLLRTWSEKAKAGDAVSNPWYKLRLVTVYSTEILLPPSLNPSLLNTALLVQLPEFTSAQVRELAQRWQQEITEQQIEQLMALLGGHPYRLQLAFYHLQQQTINLAELLENSKIASTIYAGHLQQQWWNLQRYSELLPIFTQIMTSPTPIEIEPYPASQLQKMGLIHLEGERASLACELFRAMFFFTV